jgi:hypothetical protein
MTPEQKNSRLAHVPSILMGTAALIAALSTVYVNLRGNPPAAPAAAAPAPAAPVAATIAATPSPATSAPRALRLRLDKVQVDDDGSVGSTDWTFQVSVDGEPAFSVPMPSLSDKPGENLARPAEGQDASAEIGMPAGKGVAVAVNGWKKGFLGGARGEVSGEGWLTPEFTKTAITLEGEKEKGPRFVLYFSAVPVE